MATNTDSVKEIYEMIASSDICEGAYLATIISGDEFGDKALFSDNSLTAVYGKSAYFDHSCSDMFDIKQSGVFEIEGRDVYIEQLGGEPHIVICGAGHVSMPIIRIFRMMDIRVTVIDDREEFVQNALECGANEIICKSFDEAMAEIKSDDDTYFVVVTRGHNYDTACVGGALKMRHAYVGMIGSKRHGEVVRETLVKKGISRELVDSVYTPIGLSIGAETPEEIAVAIVAEIIEIKNKKRKNEGLPTDILDAIIAPGREPMVLSTIVSKSGSGPRTVGTKMLVRKDGSITGTIGGGLAENDVIEHAVVMLETGTKTADLMRADMNARPEDEGMVCGGSANVLFEVV